MDWIREPARIELPGACFCIINRGCDKGNCGDSKCVDQPQFSIAPAKDEN